VAVLEVPQFVRQHGFHLDRLQAAKQGVEEDDAFGFAEAGEVGVAVASNASNRPSRRGPSW
jgi:hypothetical protein